MKYLTFPSWHSGRSALSLAAMLGVLSLGSGRALASSESTELASIDAQIKADLTQIETDLKADFSSQGKVNVSGNVGANVTLPSFPSHLPSANVGGAPVPEPSTWLLMGTLLFGVGALSLRERNRVRV